MSTRSRGGSRRMGAWACAVWTLAMIGLGIAYDVNRGPTIEGGDDDVSGLAYLFILGAWVIGIVSICVVVLLTNEVKYRREMRAIARERQGEPRRF